PDGSVLYVNEQTAVKLEAEGQLVVTSGEVYLETPADNKPAFTIKTPKREISAGRVSIGVRVNEDGTSVVVTRGRAKLSAIDEPLVAGEQLAPDGKEATAAPRASHLLAWTRDLSAAAESPLVPASNYAGGSLVVRDPSGQEAKLSLRKFHIDVHIENGFARTT